MQVIRFFKDVNEESIQGLLATIDQRIAQGVEEFSLLISSGGGTVFHGLSAYNYLKGLPVTIDTHNFGLVDSISVVLYCAGRKKYCSPQARFLLHTVQANYQNVSFEEPQLVEALNGLRIDTENIARVIAANVGVDVEEVKAKMLARTTLNPDEAKEWGLVDEIRTELYPAGSEVLII